ncbi:MAG: FtsX-like permease family protein [Planctomycetota bacterium]
MYQPLLTNRYLASRVIPFIAVAAVALCVALVIIVVSVMTGFLNLVKNSGRTLMGDVVVTYPVSGIAHYERLIEMVNELDDVEASSPIVDSWGLLKMPYPDGPGKEIKYIQFWGIEPETFAAVTGYADTLYWKPPTEEKRAMMRDDDFRKRIADDFGEDILERFAEAGRTLQITPADPNDNEPRPAISMGIHVSAGNDRQRDGSYEPAIGGYWFMPKFEVTLTTIPVFDGAIGDSESYIFPVANEFVSGVFLIDDKRVMIPLDIAQKMMHLDEAKTYNDLTEEEGIDPARATMVLIRGKEGVEPIALRDQVAKVYDRFHVEHLGDVPKRGLNLKVMTWEQQQANFIGPIEKERELMRTLFMLIYLVCAGLVLAIFWAIVYEKTRDIGILRSVGASRLGISWIFLRYGFVVGVMGAILGFGLGYLVVHNINNIHDAMGHPPRWLVGSLSVLAVICALLTIVRSRTGRLLPVVVGTMTTLLLTIVALGVYIIRARGGIVIWDPEVYYFTEIPNDVDVGSAIITMVGAVIFSLIGAFVPAAKAADTDPVKALRYE